MRLLTAIPVHNEEKYLEDVLREVSRYAEDVLVVDDGSTDRTPELLRRVSRRSRSSGIPRNLGYGAGLRTAFQHAIEGGYDGLVTLDCDGQHEPALIPELAAPAGRGRHRLGQPLPSRLRPEPEASRGAAADQRRGHALAQRVPGAEPDRRLLRLQGLSAVGPRAVRHHRQRLRHAAAGLGAGRPARADDRRGARPADLPRRVAGLRRLARRSTYRLNHYRQRASRTLSARPGLEVAGGCRG